jgi:hypothetical protein
MTPRLAQPLAKATGLAASAGAAVSIAWWLDPAFADATGVAVMLVGFVFTLAGLVLVLKASRGRGPDFARELSAPWAVRPRVLRDWLALSSGPVFRNVPLSVSAPVPPPVSAFAATGL